MDARGLKCPLPVLRMEKALASLATGSQLIVFATDPIAKVDIPLHCRKHGHACSVGADRETLRFTIVAGG